MGKRFIWLASLFCFLLTMSVEGVSSMKKESESLFCARRCTPPPKGCPKAKPPAGQPKEAPKGSHDNNQRESNRERHEKGDARREREQKKAEEKREQNKKK